MEDNAAESTITDNGNSLNETIVTENTILVDNNKDDNYNPNMTIAEDNSGCNQASSQRTITDNTAENTLQGRDNSQNANDYKDYAKNNPDVIIAEVNLGDDLMCPDLVLSEYLSVINDTIIKVVRMAKKEDKAKRQEREATHILASHGQQETIEPVEHPNQATMQQPERLNQAKTKKTVKKERRSQRRDVRKLCDHEIFSREQRPRMEGCVTKLIWGQQWMVVL